MDFEESERLVSNWVAAHSGQLELVCADAEEGRFDFSHKSERLSSFHIIRVVTDASSCWAVRTDVDKVFSSLIDVNKYIQSNKNVSIEQILNFMSDSLLSKPPLRGAENQQNGVDEGISSDNEEIDDYNPDEWGEDSDTMNNTRQPLTSTVGSAEAMDTGSYQCDLTKSSPLTIQRLINDMKILSNIDGQFGISGAPRGDNLFLWDVQLSDFPSNSLLSKDLKTYAKKYNKPEVINVEVAFPSDYPMAPPFVRVVAPRFKFMTGHVTIGGSICMEMLTRSGWTPSNDMESMLIQIRAAILSDPSASLDGSNNCYTEWEAKDAFNRMVLKYGWNK